MKFMGSGERDLTDRLFWIANEDEIKRAETTDVYFIYTLQILEKKGLDPRVVMEVYLRNLPYPDNWGVVSGIYEVAKLLEGLPLDVRAMEEGEIFLVSPDSIAYEPVIQIEGRYREFAKYENPILGLICMSSGISSKAARVRMCAGDKVLFSFGTRRSHPALAPMIERATYIGGFDSVSNVLGAKMMGKKPVGTMPHALIQCFGDQKIAWKSFDEIMPKEIPKIALVDTFSDEKTEAIMAFETLGDKLYGIRLDTPRSRRGNWRKIIEEVKWELKIRGGNKVKIFVSGGLDEETILELREVVDGFGVGTGVSNAPTLDFSAKIVELVVNGRDIFRAKRGDIAGKKEVYRAYDRFDDIVTFYKNPKPNGYYPLLSDLIRDGKIVRKFKSLDEIRESVLSKLKVLKGSKPTLRLI
ncbi:MAG: nicotinate phosphoribosyltransferase [Nitrososphaerales archaeon]